MLVHLVMHLVMDQCYLLLDKFEFEGILDSLMSTTSGEPGAAARVKGIFLCFYIFSHFFLHFLHFSLLLHFSPARESWLSLCICGRNKTPLIIGCFHLVQ